MKKILLPVDFSPRSASAGKYAAALACRFQAELTVLHVASGHAPYHEVNDLCLPPAYPLQIEWNEMRLKEAKDTMRSSSAIIRAAFRLHNVCCPEMRPRLSLSMRIPKQLI